MFAFFGLGMQEIVLLALLAAIPAAVLVIVLVVSRSSARSQGQMSALQEDNLRLREELNRKPERPD